MKTKILVFSCLVCLASSHIVQADDRTQTNIDKNLFHTDTNLLNSFVLGQSTNDICMGISKFSCLSNIFVCLLYVGQTNSSQLWIAPPQFQRVEYYLYDLSGKVIPYSATYHPANKIYKTISDVPKNAHGVHKGTMWPPFSMPYEQIALTSVFQIERGGDYKLVAKGRIMKINGDSSLSIMEFPLASLPIHLRVEDVPKRQ